MPVTPRLLSHLASLPPQCSYELAQCRPVVKCCNPALYVISYTLGMQYSNLSNPNNVQLVIQPYELGAHFHAVVHLPLHIKNILNLSPKCSAFSLLSAEGKLLWIQKVVILPKILQGSALCVEFHCKLHKNII